MKNHFFEERTEASEVKANIVSKYFEAWAKVIMPTTSRRDNKIAYVDLYAGPGRYKDGAASTPLLVLGKAIQDPKMASMLAAFFNDALNENTSTLADEINKLPGIDTLKYPPKITCGDVDEQAAEYFNRTKLVPTFSFIDPWGYKGLSLNIIKGVIKDWGCDCVFFFNYSRINAGIHNPKVVEHMNNLFGVQRADDLRLMLEGLKPAQRESAILESLAAEIKGLGGKFVLPFIFRNEHGTRTLHMLIFVSKHFRGYEIMKGIMSSASSSEDQGVASFRYCPADETMPLLFSLNQPFEKLVERLPNEYADQIMTRDALYENDSVDTPYLKKHYTEALKKLEEMGLVNVTTPKARRRKGTYPNHVTIHFPRIE